MDNNNRMNILLGNEKIHYKRFFYLTNKHLCPDFIISYLYYLLIWPNGG